mmetsp:Transcript_5456/g.12085  ORF Transcript_5456/g.12085 Transcript_5456/m.12085 type:complete len:83 (+) Transcript_5456:286-534(+)
MHQNHAAATLAFGFVGIHICMETQYSCQVAACDQTAVTTKHLAWTEHPRHMASCTFSVEAPCLGSLQPGPCALTFLMTGNMP